MDPVSIVEDTERVRFCPQTDGRTDGRRETSIPPCREYKEWLIESRKGFDMPGKVWGEITYPLPNFNGGTTEVWERKSNYITGFIMDVSTYARWD